LIEAMGKKRNTNKASLALPLNTIAGAGKGVLLLYAVKLKYHFSDK
jgi:hypothetical protein